MKKEIKWFSNIDSFDSLKTKYKELVKKYHPDLNVDNLEHMQEINSEYDYLLDNLAKLQDKTIDKELEEQFKEIILELVKFESVQIEVCGSWLWLHGETKEVKEDLKVLGCRFAPKKKLWYWHSPDQKQRRKGNFTMAEIRAKYGSAWLKGKDKKLLRA